MRRIRRILFNVAATLSLGMAVLIAGLWIATAGPRGGWLSSNGGWLYTNWRRSTTVGQHSFGTSGGYFTFLYETRPWGSGRRQVIGRFVKRRLGCHINIGVDDFDPAYKHFSGYVPLIYPLAVCSVLPTIAARRWWKARQRPGAGCCPACGYDLRATPNRCPECGQPFATADSAPEARQELA